MRRYLWEFVKAVTAGWVGKMSGLAGVVLAAGPAITKQFPAWAFWVAAVVCVFVAAFAAWLRERKSVEAKETEIRNLKAEHATHLQSLIGAPVEGMAALRAAQATVQERRIAILRETEAHAGYYRIRVKNLSSMGVQFSANLVAIDPTPDGHHTVALPLPLQITHESRDTVSAYIAPGETRLVDVFLMLGGATDFFQIQGRKYLPDVRIRTYRCTIRAFAHNGLSAERTFIMTPDDRHQRASFEAVPEVSEASLGG